MKNTTIIFLRHAKTEKDPSKNAALWGLSEQGNNQAKSLADNPDMQDIDIVYGSSEQKTVLTVKPLAKKLNKKIYQLGSFDEVKRGDKFLTKEQFQLEKKKQLEDLSYRAFDGESGEDALKRFIDGVEKVTQASEGKKILIASHGTILNIYFAKILNSFDKLPQRWECTEFCDYGILKNGKVIKDIVK